MKVLIVEDDATTAELVQRGLTARGVDVCAVVATIEAAVASSSTSKTFMSAAFKSSIDNGAQLRSLKSQADGS